MSLRTVILCVFMVAVTCCQCSLTRSLGPSVKISTQKGPANFDLEVVKSGPELRHGLMDRDSLPRNQGMLFMFERDEDHSFWMRNTKIPLDIVFFDKDWKVVGVIEDMVPQSELSRSIGAPSRYALELNAGTVRRTGIAVGNAATFTDRM